MAESLKLNIGEAFALLFQKGCIKKAFGTCGWIFFTVLFWIITGLLLYSGGLKQSILILCFGFISLVITIALSVSIGFIISGYYFLFARDRAYNKNALYREWTKETCKESFVTGAKLFVIYLVQIPFFAVVLFIFLVIAEIIKYALTGGFGGQISPAAEFIIGIIPLLIYISIFGVMFTRILSYFAEDLKIESLFKWGTALRRTKNVSGAFNVIFIPFSIAYIINYYLHYTILNHPREIGALGIYICLALVIITHIAEWALQCNLLGQYTYNVIEKNKNA